MGLAFSYDVSPRVTARLNFSPTSSTFAVNVLCVGQSIGLRLRLLTDELLYPAGNFYPNSKSSLPPPQLQYPYSSGSTETTRAF